MSKTRIGWVLLLATVVWACDGVSDGSDGSDAGSQESQVSTKNSTELIQAPSSAGSGEQNLFASTSGDVYLTWISQSRESAQLFFSRMDGENWTEPRLIAEGSNWFVNWADFPSLAVSDDGSMVAHYLAKNGKDTFAYGVNMVFSENGESWSNPIIPHETETETEHGFVSLIPYQDGFFAAWLDGRNTGGGHGYGGGAMSLRAAFMDKKGKIKEEFLLDDRICDCCQTSATITENGPVVAYRDRSKDEIRDMSIVRWTGAEWTSPAHVFEDNWKIPGCPVNGPALASKGNNVAMAWFTSPERKSMVKLAFSTDGGATFGPPRRVDNGNPIGRVAMDMLNDGSVFVSWMEAEGEEAQIMVGKYGPDKIIEKPFVLAKNSSARASGFPRMTSTSDYVYFVWRDMTQTDAQLVTARIEI